MKKSNQIYLSCKDFSVSQERFDLFWNEEKDILITSPIPDISKLPKYYKSENYISHTDGKRNLFERAYQAVKSFMLQHKLKLIENCQPVNKTILDIGAGTGDFLAYLKKKDWQVKGVEPNPSARNLAEQKGITLHQDISELPTDDKFEVITLWHVLEHIPDLENFILQLKSRLTENGVLIIAVPNFKSYDARYYQNFWAAYDVPRHLWHFSQKGIKRLFAAHQFSIQKSKPLWFDAFYVSLLSEKYKSNSSNFIKPLFVGLMSNLKAISSKEYSSLIYFLKKDI
ncbi:class I SAM-dependent methyltransferase [Mesonia sp. K7]|uniref:class I SAM-dependent methyltransferase n=1 Tax=Mesonia sp. K7 TaxID=2218606 RepID=UPI0026C7FBB3